MRDDSQATQQLAPAGQPSGSHSLALQDAPLSSGVGRRETLMLVLIIMLVLVSSTYADDRLTFYNFGDLRIGMPENAAIQAFHPRLSGTSNEDCKYYNIPSDPGISFIVEDGKVVRIDLSDSHHRTVSGLSVGDTESKALFLYGGRYEVTPHRYVENGHYITVRSRDRTFAMVIETDGEYVIVIRSGRVPAAEYVEGCL